jgi:hypothetical protein
MVYAFVQAGVAQMFGPRREEVSVAVTSRGGRQHSSAVALPGSQTLKASLVESYGKLPLVFEANQGQTDAQVKFLSRGPGYSLFLTQNEAVVRLRPSPSAQPSALRMKLLNANVKAEISGQDELPGTSNYFAGSDPSMWHTNVRRFAKVRYQNVYPGVDLVYYGNQRQLEYDFVVRPGTDPSVIRLAIDGANRIVIERGDLVLTRQPAKCGYQDLKCISQCKARSETSTAVSW